MNDESTSSNALTRRLLAHTARFELTSTKSVDTPNFYSTMESFMVALSDGSNDVELMISPHIDIINI